MSGCSAPAAILDIDGDGTVDETDLVDGDVPAGVEIGTGLPSKPSLVGPHVLVQTSTAEVLPVTNDPDWNQPRMETWHDSFLGCDLCP